MVLKHAFIIISSFFLVGTASAQTQNTTKQDAPKTESQKQEQTVPQIQAPQIQVPQTQLPKTDRKTDAFKKVAPKDLDEFFKEGAEQAKEGSTCRTPPVPVA